LFLTVDFTLIGVTSRCHPSELTMLPHREHVSCLYRQYGVVGNTTALLKWQAPEGPLTPLSAWLLRHMTLRNRGNQDAAAEAGAVGAAFAVLASNATAWGRTEAVLLATELMRGNAKVKEDALAEGTGFVT